jgi:hypothetical protein
MCHPRREEDTMSKNDDRQQPNDRVLNRRSILLGV